MKKLSVLILSLVFMFSLAACGGNDAPEENSQSGQEETTPVVSSNEDTTSDSDADEGGELVVYFSWSGNTESVANAVQEATGADIFEITPAEPYTDDYNTLLDIAQNEQRSDARPAIADSLTNLDDYRTIYLGYPNWWGDMPMILYTFLDEYDLSGKTVAPFVTSGGSGFSNTENTIKELEPNANVVEGLSIGDTESSNPGDDVAQWLESLN